MFKKKKKNLSSITNKSDFLCHQAQVFAIIQLNYKELPFL